MSIKVKIVADSVNSEGVRLTTYELEYPRYIHAEIMTHRVFSRNAQSSRAVPVKKSLEMESIVPIEWGKNKSGMSSTEKLEGVALESAQALWDEAVKITKTFSSRLSDIGLHKQWANRMTEWFSPIKVVVTATEWDNFFWLRIDPDAAQPEIVELAKQMFEARENSVPMKLLPGEWHLPYVESVIDYNELIKMREQLFFVGEDEIGLDDAIKISASACAQVSYRNLDTSIEKALSIYNRLFDGPKPHLSPVEHQATPIDFANFFDNVRYIPDWQAGVTHMDKNGDFWSGNFKGFIQYRQLI